MPIRDAQPTLDGKIYRSFRFGDLATLIMLDTRIIGRDEQAPRENVNEIESPGRQLLGAEQEGWLAEQFTDVGPQQRALDAARPAGDVRAADADGRRCRERGFVGRLSRRARGACST